MTFIWYAPFMQKIIFFANCFTKKWILITMLYFLKIWILMYMIRCLINEESSMINLSKNEWTGCVLRNLYNDIALNILNIKKQNVLTFAKIKSKQNSIAIYTHVIVYF